MLQVVVQKASMPGVLEAGIAAATIEVDLDAKKDTGNAPSARLSTVKSPLEIKFFRTSSNAKH